MFTLKTHDDAPTKGFPIPFPKWVAGPTACKTATETFTFITTHGIVKGRLSIKVKKFHVCHSVYTGRAYACTGRWCDGNREADSAV